MTESAVNVFELEPYMEINRAREVWVRRVLGELLPAVPMRTAVDLGCGGGYFCGVLAELGLEVTGVDGRAVNIERTEAICPGGRHVVAELDEPGAFGTLGIGPFDLGFVFGLLYHLRHPVLAIDALGSLVSKVCLISTRCAAGEGVSFHAYTEYEGDAHSGHRYSCVPTRDAYLWAFREAGWAYLYETPFTVEHREWDPTLTPDGLRLTMVASREPIEAPSLRLIEADPKPVKKWDRGAPA